jgi:hypothetical protein
MAERYGCSNVGTTQKWFGFVSTPAPKVNHAALEPLNTLYSLAICATLAFDLAVRAEKRQVNGSILANAFGNCPV